MTPKLAWERVDMVCSSILDFRVLVVPGLHDSGPDHWQSRWQRLYPFFERIEQEQWDVPDLGVWSERLDRSLRASTLPTLIVAHSFGCLTTVHRAACTGSATGSAIAGALLVAPPDADKFSVADQLQDVRLPFPSILIGSTSDPWMDGFRAAHWATVWGCEFIGRGLPEGTAKRFNMTGLPDIAPNDKHEVCCSNKASFPALCKKRL